VAVAGIERVLLNGLSWLIEAAEQRRFHQINSFGKVNFNLVAFMSQPVIFAVQLVEDIISLLSVRRLDLKTQTDWGHIERYPFVQSPIFAGLAIVIVVINILV